MSSPGHAVLGGGDLVGRLERQWLWCGRAIVVAGLPFLWLAAHWDTGAAVPAPWVTGLQAAGEAVALMVAGLIFFSGWHQFGNVTRNAMLIAFGFLGVAVLSLAHLACAAAGGESAPFAMAGRYLAVALVLVASFAPDGIFHNRRRWWVLGMTLAASAGLLVGLALAGRAGVVADGGLLDAGAALLLAVAVVVGARRRRAASWNGELWMLALCSLLLSELFFAVPAAGSESGGLFGQWYRVFTYAALYRLLYLENIRVPYVRLEHMQQQLAEKQRFLDALVSDAPDGILVADESGTIRLVNQRLLRDFGYEHEAELVGQPIEVLLPASERGRHMAYRSAYIRKPGRREMGANGPSAGLHRDGHTVWVEISLAATVMQGRPCAVAFVRNVAERFHLEDERRRLLAVLQESPDWVIQADDDLRVTYLNPAAQRAFGDIAGVAGAARPMLLADVFDPAAGQVLEGILEATRRECVFSGESRLLVGGSGVPVSLVVIAHRSATGGAMRYSMVARDLSERVDWEQQLAHHATHDALTGLPNRLILANRIETAIATAGRNRTLAAVMFIDLDNFKQVNDGFGHSAGDELLAVTARRLQHCLRQGDTLARFGGDEFVVVAQGLRGEGDAAAVAHKLLLALDPPVPVGGAQLLANASIGICLVPRDAANPEAALSHADQAMYRAKRGGRGHYRFFTLERDALGSDSMTLVTALKEALRGDSAQLSLCFQPQLSVPDGAIIGVECLLRWHHPVIGTVSPARFIPLAEESGLILSLGDWVLHAVCRQIVDWRRQDVHVPVAVNVSAHELCRPDFAERVEATLAQYGVAHEQLELEITETALMGRLDSAAGNLERLRRSGIRIALDDFGTGYSSLAHLKSLSLDRLKIDRGFVKGASQNNNNGFILEAVLNLGRQLHLDVIAEGVESTDDLQLLMELGCRQMQGWLFYPALTPAECLDALRAKPQPVAAGETAGNVAAGR